MSPREQSEEVTRNSTGNGTAAALQDPAAVPVFHARSLSKVYHMGEVEVRVNVLIDITSPAEQWARLGDAYQLDARIVVFTRDDATIVPGGALFRRGDQWNVYVVKWARADSQC